MRLLSLAFGILGVGGLGASHLVSGRTVLNSDVSHAASLSSQSVMNMDVNVANSMSVEVLNVYNDYISMWQEHKWENIVVREAKITKYKAEDEKDAKRKAAFENTPEIIAVLEYYDCKVVNLEKVEVHMHLPRDWETANVDELQTDAWWPTQVSVQRENQRASQFAVFKPERDDCEVPDEIVTLYNALTIALLYHARTITGTTATSRLTMPYRPGFVRADQFLDWLDINELLNLNYKVAAPNYALPAIATGLRTAAIATRVARKLAADAAKAAADTARELAAKKAEEEKKENSKPRGKKKKRSRQGKGPANCATTKLLLQLNTWKKNNNVMQQRLSLKQHALTP